jgi:Carboxypeptidase regulatory-like domain/TonB-dependent Receptor Plug Domain
MKTVLNGRLRHGVDSLCASAIALTVAGLAASTASPLHAQIVVGHVIADMTKEPVHRAEVQLLGPDGEAAVSATSDSTGDFQMRATSPGAYTLRIRHIAYVTYVSRPIEVRRGETVEFEIRLGTSVIPLEPLVVTARSADRRLAEFYDRLERNAFGKFLTREQIDEYPALQVTDLFRTFTGVRVVPIGGSTRSLVTMRGTTGRCLPAVYLDGVRIEQSADFPIDDLLAPDFLEGVEVYTSTAGAPVGYQDANCGVILFWSRSFQGGGRPFSWKRLVAGIATAGLIILIAR